MDVDAEAWNDDVMVGLLHDAIRTHRTKQDDASGRRGELEWTTPAAILEGRQSFDGDVPSAEIHVSPSGLESLEHEAEATQTTAAHATTSSDYLHSQTRRALAADPSMDEPLTTLLMAWYNCGYATGRYQTLMELQGLPGAASNNSLPHDAAFPSMEADEGTRNC